MNNQEFITAEPFPISGYVRDELAERGWSTLDAAVRLGGTDDEVKVNTCWLDFVCCDEIWFDGRVQFTDEDAIRLAKIFGTSDVVWMNLHKSFLRAVAAGRKRT